MKVWEWERRFTAALERRMKHRVRAVIANTHVDYGNMLAAGVQHRNRRTGLRVILRKVIRKDPERIAFQFARKFIAWTKRPQRGRRPGWKKTVNHKRKA